jgi:hypothetical protein
MKIYSFRLIVTIALLFCGCQQDKDGSLSQALIGTWHCIQTNPDGLTIDRNVTFSPEGTMSMSGNYKFRGRVWLINASGTWHVKDGYFDYTVQTSNMPKLIPNGFSSADHIVSVTGTEYTYVDGQNGKTTVETRVK